MNSDDESANNYLKYRGKCLKFCQEAVKDAPSLRLVRGYYHCPVWGKQPHWWTVRPDGTIHDPTRFQFPFEGSVGEYEEFNGTLECAECGKSFPEEGADIEGNYAFCSYICHMRFVGLAEFIR